MKLSNVRTKPAPADLLVAAAIVILAVLCGFPAGDSGALSAPNGLCVLESDCPNQDCVHSGVITRAGQSIVCLPARIVIELHGGSGDGVDAVLG